jgi:hypothetical protein
MSISSPSWAYCWASCVNATNPAVTFRSFAGRLSTSSILGISILQPQTTITTTRSTHLSRISIHSREGRLHTTFHSQHFSSSPCETSNSCHWAPYTYAVRALPVDMIPNTDRLHPKCDNVPSISPNVDLTFFGLSFVSVYAASAAASPSSSPSLFTSNSKIFHHNPLKFNTRPCIHNSCLDVPSTLN